jgi:hypothetical protein
MDMKYLHLKSWGLFAHPNIGEEEEAIKYS